MTYVERDFTFRRRIGQVDGNGGALAAEEHFVTRLGGWRANLALGASTVRGISKQELRFEIERQISRGDLSLEGAR